MLKYEWIYSQLLTQIQTGSFQAGAKLPSIRQLSQQFSCSKSTILASLKKLEDQHLIYSLPKSGYYVVDHQLPIQPKMKNYIDFATSSPNWHAFPYQDFQHCINKAIDTYQADLFTYGTPKGLPSLIAEAKKLLTGYQLFTKEENIFITSGVQQSLSLLSIMPFPNGRSTILVEQPSYHLYMDYLKTYELPAMGIKRTTDGIDLDELATHLADYQSSKEICMHSHIILPRQVNTSKIIDHLAQQNILLDPIKRNYLDAFYQERIIKLNVSNIDESQIDVGIREIALALHNTSNYF